MMMLSWPLCLRAAAPVDFKADVAPILEQHCLSCHADGNAKGDLSLTTFKHLEENGYVVAGDPDGSYLLELVIATEGKRPEMPKKGEPLTSMQVELLRRWIEQGAKWPAEVKLEEPAVDDRSWWSLNPLIAAKVPASEAAHPVDAFIDAKLKEKQLVPLQQADPRTLIRRLTYDLTGLPPTPEEIDNFLAANKKDPDAAWSALVDRLLAAPEFGEKIGQHWLDLSRYGESHGYDKDHPRMNSWPYRDYVIRSFNEDKPYARFVQEQVAGDVLFPGEPDGVLGLGFLAAGPWDFIGHSEVGEGKMDGRIAKHLDRDEMISAVFNVFMSTTVQCAQCHHHKFDPIRMEDYYGLHAVFAAVDRADRVYQALSPEKQQKKQLLVERMEVLQAEQESIDSEYAKRHGSKMSDIDKRLTELKQQYPSELKPEYGFHSSVVPEADTAMWVQVDLGHPQLASHVRLMPAFDMFNNIGAGFGFPVRFRVEVSTDENFEDESVRCVLDATNEDQQNPGSRPVLADVGGAPIRYVRLTATKLALRQNDYVFALGELQVFRQASGDNVALGANVTSPYSIEVPVRWGQKNLTDGIFYQEVSDPIAFEEYIQLDMQRAAIEDPEAEARKSEIETSLNKLKKQLNAIPEGEVVYAAATHFKSDDNFHPTNGKPRKIHLLNRGDLRSPRDEMSPGAPGLWTDEHVVLAPGAPKDEGAARADLAMYLTQPDNPLVWRSIANRVWQWIFGHPLVATPNDFGRMGMEPTHPELLDYLAARLRDDPQQSVKSLVRLLVHSQAYRRKSGGHVENSLIDSGNSYQWRFDRRRLSAEELRDSMLAISGMLQLDKRGGPSFQDFVIEQPTNSPHYEYHLHDPDSPESHRRTIYRFVVRSQPQPMLTALDCADPSMSVPLRDESTTAIQALTQWNNPLVEVMSRHLAERLQQAAADDIAKQVELACQLAWGRSPGGKERVILLDLMQTQGAATFARVLLNSSALTYVD